MTTVYTREVACGLCGKAQAVTRIGSPDAVGSMDLDTRPPEMRRSTMRYWLHECAECGYVAGELGLARGSDAHVVASRAYRQELNRGDRSHLANVFVCSALLEENYGDLVMAGWRRLHAAWACEDVSLFDEARAQRLAALELFERARAQGEQAVKSMAGGDESLLADIARRAGQFERAIHYCEAGLALEGLPGFLTHFLRFERALALQRDHGRYTVDDAQGRGRPAAVTPG